jgi:hypothetical protein
MKPKKRPSKPGEMRIPNWFEERSSILILSICDVIDSLGPNFREKAPGLEQALFEAVRLHRQFCLHSKPPSLNTWFNGDLGQDPEHDLTELQKLIANPKSAASWLEASARASGVQPPNEW